MEESPLLLTQWLQLFFDCPVCKDSCKGAFHFFFWYAVSLAGGFDTTGLFLNGLDIVGERRH